MESATITTLLGSSVGLAGILLVFVGFLYSRSEAFENVKLMRKFKRVAKAGIVPFLFALISAWLCLLWIGQPSVDLYNYAMLSFQASLILTGLYGIIAFIYYL